MQIASIVFSSNVLLYIEKNPVENLCKVLKMELKTYNPVDLKFVFVKIRVKVLHYIQQIQIFNELNMLLSNLDLNSEKHIIFAGDFDLFLDHSLNAKCGSPSLKKHCLSKLLKN